MYCENTFGGDAWWEASEPRDAWWEASEPAANVPQRANSCPKLPSWGLGAQNFFHDANVVEKLVQSVVGFSKFSTLTNHLMFSLVECFLVSSGTEVLWCHCWLRSKPYRCRAMGAITGFGPPTAASCSPSTKRCSPAAGKLVLNFRTCSSVGV